MRSCGGSSSYPTLPFHLITHPPRELLRIFIPAMTALLLYTVRREECKPTDITTRNEANKALPYPLHLYPWTLSTLYHT